MIVLCSWCGALPQGTGGHMYKVRSYEDGREITLEFCDWRCHQAWQDKQLQTNTPKFHGDPPDASDPSEGASA